MNRIKRILSMVLVCVMVLAIAPVVSPTDVSAAAATGTTELFNGNATYLLQERFAETKTIDSSNTGNKVFSGWDIDYRGGSVTANNCVATLADTDGFEKISLNHKLMEHSGGGLVLETAFKYTSAVDSGFYYEMSGDGNADLKISVERLPYYDVNAATNNDKCVFAINGVNTDIACITGKTYNIKAEFTESTITVYINGELADSVARTQSVIDEIEIGTAEETVATVELNYVYVYINYTVNESFLGSSVVGWDTANGSVTTAPGSPYASDLNGFALDSVEEASYAYDDARVKINLSLDNASEITAKADTTKFESGVSYQGRSGVLKVDTTAAVSGNDRRVGVILNGSEFSFEQGDILEYSIDVCPTVQISMTNGVVNTDYVMLRQQNGKMAPWRNVAPTQTLKQNEWTTITNAITFDDLTANDAGDWNSDAKDFSNDNGADWDTPGSYQLYMRFNGVYYLDNFKVTVRKADSKHFTDMRIGERFGVNSSLDHAGDLSWTGTGATTSVKLTEMQTAFGRNGVIKAENLYSNNTNHVGVLLGNKFVFKPGDVISYSIDVYSEEAGITPNVWIRDQGDTAPFAISSHSSLAVGAWTTLEKTITYDEIVANSIASGSTGAFDTEGKYAFYIRIGEESYKTLYLDNFKVSITNYEDALGVPFSVNAKSAKDITWRGHSSTAEISNVSDDERGAVISAEIAGTNGDNVGFLLGNSYQFHEGDIVSYSFDVKSNVAARPDVWIREQSGSDWNVYKQVSTHAMLTADEWTTVKGSVTYDELYAENNKFANAGKFAVYIRTNSGTGDVAATLLLDNFKVTVSNPNQHIVDFVDGTRFIETANSAGGITLKGSSVVVEDAEPSTDAAIIGDREGVVKASGLQDNYQQVVGFLLGKPYQFKEGDVLSYSVDVYSSHAKPDVWLRLTSNQFYQFTNTVAENTWTNINGTVTYDQLIAKDSKFANAANYEFYIRTAGNATVYFDNFTVTVKNENYAFGDAATSLAKSFTALSGKQSFSFNVLIPETGADGLKATFGGAEFKAENGKFILNDEEVYTYTNNVWYKINIETDGSTADVYVNGVPQITGVSASGTLDSIAFTNTSGKSIIVDDIQVCESFEASDYTDYPAAPEIKTTDYNLAMVSYPLWREGIQYGWDFLSSFDYERKPTLGYYTGGSQEVADWHNKWMLEHGLDHIVFPMPRPDADGAIKMAVRGEELHDGYLNSEYRKKTVDGEGLGFAVMITQPTNERYDSAAEFIENVQPYMIEHYFKNPAYKRITVNGQERLVVYSYNFNELAIWLSNSYTGTADQPYANDYNAVNTVLQSLNDAVKDLGIADGIILVTDIHSSDAQVSEYINAGLSFSDYVYKWRYTWGSDEDESIAGTIVSEYTSDTKIVASIPMGFDKTPWEAATVGLMEPEQVENICRQAKEGFDAASSPLNLFMFTCWDEWGEGHFYAPSEKAGFGYLNAISSVFAGSELESAIPTEKAVKRMGVLYPEGRQMLKVRDKVTINPSDFTNQLSEPIDLTKSTMSLGWSEFEYSKEGELNHVEATRTRNSDGTYEISYTGQGGYAQQVTWDLATVGYTGSIDIREITAIKMYGYAENSAEVVLKLGTATNQNYPEQYRFAGEASSTPGEIILYPSSPTAHKNQANNDGDWTLTSVQFNLTVNTVAGSDFDIDTITFYTGAMPGAGVTVDDESYNFVSKTIENGGTTLVPAYKFLIDMGAEVTWDATNKKLYATKDGVTAVYQAGFRNVVDETGDKIIVQSSEAGKTIYQEGNLYVEYSSILAPFGYTVTKNDAGEISYYSKFYGQSYDDTDYKWDFEIDGNLDGWYSRSETTHPAFVKNGMLHVRSVDTTDPQIFREDINIPNPEDNKIRYVIMYLKKSDFDTRMRLRLYDGEWIDDGNGNNTSGAEHPFNPDKSGLTYDFAVSKSDETQCIILDLANTEPVAGDYSKLGTTITDVRLDVMDGKNCYGSIYIDSIQFTKNHPIPFQFKAYSFGDNLLTNYRSAYWYCSNVNTYTSNWGSDMGIQHGDEFYIEPSGTNAEGFVGIMRLYSGGELYTVLKDQIVRLSFDYKTDGDCYRVRVDNRNDGRYDNTLPAYDGEQIWLDPSTEWRHFDGYISMNEDTTAGLRVFAIRAFRSDAKGNNDGALTGGVHVKNIEVRSLNTDEEATMFTDNGVAIQVIDNRETPTDTTKVFVSAFDTVNKELNNFISGSIPNKTTVMINNANTTETYDHYYMAPTDATTEIRTYVWDDFEPLSEPFVLQKAE